MTNAEATAKFFANLGPDTRADILANIAKNYHITKAQALDEILDDEAKDLLEYVTIQVRPLVGGMMRHQGLR